MRCPATQPPPSPGAPSENFKATKLLIMKGLDKNSLTYKPPVTTPVVPQKVASWSFSSRKIKWKRLPISPLDPTPFRGMGSICIMGVPSRVRRAARASRSAYPTRKVTIPRPSNPPARVAVIASVMKLRLMLWARLTMRAASWVHKRQSTCSPHYHKNHPKCPNNDSFIYLWF